MIELARIINDTQKIDKDYLIVVDGETGMGKSTFSILLALKTDPNFDIYNNIIYSQTELIEAITNSEPGKTYIVDEAVNVLFKRDFAKTKQKFILRLMDMCRDKNLCLMFCVPNFWSLDKHILEGRIKLRAYIAKTGLAFMWKPTGNPFTADRWRKKYNEKVCWNWESNPAAKRTKGFIGHIKFGDLPKKYKEKYLEVKQKKKEEVKKQEEEAEEKEAKRKKEDYLRGRMEMLYLLKRFKKIPQGTIQWVANEEGISKGAMHQRLRQVASSVESEY